MFAAPGPEPVVAIKMGKCAVEPHRDEAKRAAGKLWITPSQDKGEVIIVKKDDVNHFQWRSREMPCAVDPAIDTMVFPGDANFVKTSTGFSKGGATVEDVALMRRTVGAAMGIKASGGVRSTEDLHKMVKAGATRIGASASVAIVQGNTATGGGY